MTTNPPIILTTATQEIMNKRWRVKQVVLEKDGSHTFWLEEKKPSGWRKYKQQLLAEYREGGESHD
jgi:hypothetical protein